jgi:hypothetical protein
VTQAGVVLLAVVALVGLLPVTALAATQGKSPPGVQQAPRDISIVCDFTTMANTITNRGLYGRSAQDIPSCEWPAGSHNHYLYEGRLWVGAKVGETYYVTWGDEDEWVDTREDSNMVVTSNNQGLVDVILDPANSDTYFWYHEQAEPSLCEVYYDENAVSEFDTYTEMIDTHTDYNQYPLGVKVVQKTHGWTYGYADDFIIYEFEVINMGTDYQMLEDVYVGFHFDWDISSGEGTQPHIDDLTQFDIYDWPDGKTTYTSYMYDDENPNIAGPDVGGPSGQSQGFGGMCCLRSSLTKDGLEDQPATHRWWDWNSDPGDDVEAYNYMAETGYGDVPGTPFDYRFLQAYGPYDIAAGDTVDVAVAVGCGLGLDGMRLNMKWAKDLYDNNWIGPTPPSSPSLSVDAGDRQVDLTWTNDPESEIDPVSGLADFEGYRLWRSPTGVEGSWALLGDWDKIDDIGRNTGLRHQYLDTDVHNGYPYYYSITSYDTGEPSLGLESLESSTVIQKTFAQPGAPYTGSLEDIAVVPNPYKGVAAWDWEPSPENPSKERVSFIHLPSECTIQVFTLDGDQVIEIRHDEAVSGRTYENWDLISRDGFIDETGRPSVEENRGKIVAGIYLFHVDADEGTHIGKFVVIR